MAETTARARAATTEGTAEVTVSDAMTHAATGQARATRELEGKVALITGAAGAIGSAIARALAADGARPVIADLDLAAAEKTAASIPGARAVQLDVADRES